MIQDQAALEVVAVAIDESRLVGLDVETTGLDPRRDRIRLISLEVETLDGGTFTYLVDCAAVDPRPLSASLAERPVLAHNAAFDVAMMGALGFEPGKVVCTQLLSQLLAAGTVQPRGFHKLETCLQRELSITIDKTEQQSDWVRSELTTDQLRYAAADVQHLHRLHDALSRKLKAAGLDAAAEIESRCLPALVCMSRHGVAFDRDAWQGLAQAADDEARRLETELDRVAPPRIEVLFGGGWNWNSPEQVQQALARAGCKVKDTTDETLASAGHPLAHLIRDYRQARKRTTTYGRDWLKHVAEDGRIYTNWRQLGCKTGRMASSGPNLQNIPRDGAYRRCFRAPPGRVLVKADYSQIELRIAAKIANEARMIAAYQRGEDLHTITAQQMTGRTTVTPSERQLAKPVNFGLIYGLGADTLQRKAKTDYGLDLSQQDAERYRRAFFTAYPGIKRWHNRICRDRAKETRTLTGRRVLVEADGFFGAKANYMVQGTGGDGIKLALALLWERRREFPAAFPVLAVHDEIVVECDCEQARAVEQWLRQAMLDALTPLLDPVPVEVEVKIAQTWGGE
jgi:DNA polymerase-1